jgi:molecular chaperone GrpE
MSDTHQAGAEEVEDPLGPPAEDSPLDGSADGPPDGSASARSDDGQVVDAELLDDADGPAPSSVEELIVLLEQATAQRDEYLDALRRNQADFENSRRRLAKEAVDAGARATGSLVEQLLPVLDGCDGAITHGATEVEPIWAALLGALEKQGLERIDPSGEAFDPNRHEAVMHEPADDGDDGTVVSAVMRAGYVWKGRMVRPAMVKVKG